MERAFLDSFAVHLHEKYASNLSNLVVVLPNKRAGLFLKQHLSKYFKNTIWLPQIISSEDFFLQLSQFKKLDSISLLFRFYEAYQNCNADNGETFEEFAQWGQLLLQDFNEIDQYLIDTEALFSYVNDVRAIEVWNVDGSEITDTQKNYLAFWKQFKPYYESFRKLLLARKECYQGLAYRWVAENMQSQQIGRAHV